MRYYGGYPLLITAGRNTLLVQHRRLPAQIRKPADICYHFSAVIGVAFARLINS